MNDLIDNDDIKVAVSHFEVNEEHFIAVDGSFCRTSPNVDGAVHEAEIRVVASYDSLARHLTTLTQVKSDSGTAGGKTIYPLRKEQNPKDFMAVNVRPGIYDLTQANSFRRYRSISGPRRMCAG